MRQGRKPGNVLKQSGTGSGPVGRGRSLENCLTARFWGSNPYASEQRRKTRFTMGNNKTKAAQLGMPLGTAQNRLRKRVLFAILVRHKENICYRCDKPIETVEELSLDHKKPWLGFDTELYWNVENIAFSHLSCNSAAARPGLQAKGQTFSRKFDKGPIGTLWCTTCQMYLEIKSFHKNRARTSGYEDICAKCCRERTK